MTLKSAGFSFMACGITSRSARSPAVMTSISAMALALERIQSAV